MRAAPSGGQETLMPWLSAGNVSGKSLLDVCCPRNPGADPRNLFRADGSRWSQGNHFLPTKSPHL